MEDRKRRKGREKKEIKSISRTVLGGTGREEEMINDEGRERRRGRRGGSEEEGREGTEERIG